MGVPFPLLIVGQVIRVTEREIQEARKYWSTHQDFEYEIVIMEDGKTGLKCTANRGKRLATG
jgi:hypothetical protein